MYTHSQLHRLKCSHMSFENMGFEKKQQNLLIITYMFKVLMGIAPHGNTHLSKKCGRILNHNHYEG